MEDEGRDGWVSEIREGGRDGGRHVELERWPGVRGG